MASRTVRIRLAWWLRAYLAGCELVASLTGLEPDWDKVRAKLESGIRVEVLKV